VQDSHVDAKKDSGEAGEDAYGSIHVSVTHVELIQHADLQETVKNIHVDARVGSEEREANANFNQAVQCTTPDGTAVEMATLFI